MTKKGASGDFLFHFCKKWTIFSYKKIKMGGGGGGGDCGCPTGHNYGLPLDRKQTFFVDSLMPSVKTVFPIYMYLPDLINIQRSIPYDYYILCSGYN